MPLEDRSALLPPIRTMFVLGSFSAFAIASEPQTSEPVSPPPDDRHRFDFSYNRLDSREAESDIVLLGYSIAVGRVRIGVTGSYLSADIDYQDPDTGDRFRSRESGWGDTRIVLQYDPSERVTINPWVPDQLGFYAIMTAPTGDVDLGLGAGAAHLQVGFGAPIFLSSKFALLPSGYYGTTFSEQPEGLEDEELGLTLGLYWLFPDGLWVGYEPTVAHNFFLDDRGLDHRLIIGKLFRTGFGVGVEVFRRDRLDPFASRDDYAGQVNIYYVFGAWGQAH